MLLRERKEIRQVWSGLVLLTFGVECSNNNKEK